MFDDMRFRLDTKLFTVSETRTRPMVQFELAIRSLELYVQRFVNSIPVIPSAFDFHNNVPRP